jgi:alkanesulfonate monooxygenase SsuD/methylene tetrahydromethanopterin reductase-like flavin-dependent oxidoreductase (luciferase family)
LEFGFCYLCDYHPEVHGDYRSWYSRLIAEWQLADSLDFDAIWIAEHRFSGYGFSSTPVVAQALADHTKNIRIGTAVALLSQRHPILTAEDWAAVDLLSGGRLNFGIGRGIFAYDFEVMGIPSAESRARFEEAWDVIRKLWSQETASHAGQFWQFPEHRLGPRPLQQPLPPVFVGCVASPESYVFAGTHGYNIIVSPFLLESSDRQRKYVDLYRATLEANGFDPASRTVTANYHLALFSDESDRETADQYFFNYLRFLHSANRASALDEAAYSQYRPGQGLYNDVKEMRRSRTIIGNSQECIDKMADLAESVGVTGWMFHINYGMQPHERVKEQMHQLHEEIVPAFNQPSQPASDGGGA